MGEDGVKQESDYTREKENRLLVEVRSDMAVKFFRHLLPEAFSILLLLFEKHISLRTRLENTPSHQDSII